MTESSKDVPQENVENSVEKDVTPPMDLNSLLPLGMQYLDNQQKQIEANLVIQRENIQAQETQIKIEKSQFNYRFALLVMIVVTIFGISIGLMFWKDNIAAGLGLLSHIGAVIVGIIAGSGWERTREVSK